MMDFLDMAAQRWWQWMLPMSVQVCILAVIVLTLDGLLKRKAWPQLRAALWLVVLIKLVVPPTVRTPVSISRMEINTSLMNQAADAVPVSANLIRVAFWIWSAGFIAALLATIWRHRRNCTAWLQTTVPWPAHLNGAIERAARQLGMRRQPRVIVAESVHGPAVIGFFRPVVVLPADLMAPGESRRLEHVLLHELAHVRRRDPLRHLACLILRLAYWFHPAVWIAHARSRTLREICCDDTVARCLQGRAGEYRQTLLLMARSLLERSSPAPAPVGFVHHHSQLMARLDWLSRPITPRSPIRGVMTWLACAVLLVSCVPMGTQAAKHASDFFLQQPGLNDGCLRLRYTVMGLLAKEAAESNEVNQG